MDFQNKVYKKDFSGQISMSEPHSITMLHYLYRGYALLILLIAIIIGLVIYFMVFSTIFKPDFLPRKSRTTIGTEQKLIAKAEEIIKQGTDIDAVQNQYGQTLLHIAVGSGYAEAVKLLLDNNANVNARDSLNGTPLHRAVQNGHVDVAKILIKYGADIEARYDTGSTPLYFAIDAKSNRKEVMSLLLSAGASVNVVDSFGSPPLGSAIHVGHSDAVELLIKHGADVNFRDKFGGTLLHEAAYLGRAEIAELLIQHRADVNARAKDGETPLRAALEKPFPGVSQVDKDRVAQVLRAYGGKQ
jgi:ankyrin repeat protein